MSGRAVIRLGVGWRWSTCRHPAWVRSPCAVWGSAQVAVDARSRWSLGLGAEFSEVLHTAIDSRLGSGRPHLLLISGRESERRVVVGGEREGVADDPVVPAHDANRVVEETTRVAPGDDDGKPCGDRGDHDAEIEDE